MKPIGTLFEDTLKISTTAMHGLMNFVPNIKTSITMCHFFISFKFFYKINGQWKLKQNHSYYYITHIRSHGIMKFDNIMCHWQIQGGCHMCRWTTQQSRFFHFHRIIFQKVPASLVGLFLIVDILNFNNVFDLFHISGACMVTVLKWKSEWVSRICDTSYMIN